MNPKTRCAFRNPFLNSLIAAGMIGGAALHAAPQYFTNAGGPITWDQGTTANWSNTSGGTYDQLWGQWNDAVFEGASGTVNVSGQVDANSLTFNVDGYVLSGGKINTGNPSGGPVMTVVDNNTATINSDMSNMGFGATKSGTGTLILGGSGGTNKAFASMNVSQGTLRLNTAASLGVTSIQNGAFLTTGTDWALANVGAITVNAGGTLRADNSLANQLNGLTLNGGTVDAIGGGNGDWGNFYLTNNVSASGNSSLNADIALRATTISFDVSSGGNLNVGGVLHDGHEYGRNSGVGAIVIKSGVGTMTLTGGNSYSGATSVNGGALVLSGSANANNSDITMANSANLTFAAGDSRSFTKAITGAAGDVTFNVAGNTSASGGGDGTNFSFQNTGSFTGNVVINSGLVAPSSDSAFGDAANVIKLNAASGQSAGLVATSSITLPSSRSIELTNSGGNGVFRAYAGNTFEIAGEISGAGNLEKTDGGTLTLSGVSTYAGATLVSAGTLLVTGELGNTAVSVASNATIGGSGSIAGSLNFGDGAKLTVNLADPLSIAGSVTFTSFGFDDLVNFNVQTVEEGTYTLLSGSSFNFANVVNYGEGNALVRDDGKLAYFNNGSLQVVVVPEPEAALLGGLGLLALLRRRR